MRLFFYTAMQALLLALVACSGNEALPTEDQATQTDIPAHVTSLQRSEAEAKAEALQFLASLSPEVRGTSAHIDSVSYLLSEDTSTSVRSSSQRPEVDTLLYILNLDQGGTIIASGHRAKPPVLAYLETDKPVGSEILREETGTGFDDVAKRLIWGGPGKPGEVPEKPIDYLINGIGDTIGANREVSYSKLYLTVDKCKPLLQVEWHQGWPYNTQTPIINGQHTVTGCVPVAMAQIASYFKSSQKIDGKTPDWEGMISNTMHPDIPTFMRHLGKVMDSDYREKGTSTSLWMIASGFRDIGLTYEIGKAIAHSSFYSTDRTINDLKHKRPILISGVSLQYDAEGGHAWVIDGFLKQETTLFKHIGSPNGNGSTKPVRTTTQLYLHCNWGSPKPLNGYFIDKIFTPANRPNIEEEQEGKTFEEVPNYNFDYELYTFYGLGLK